MIVADTSAWIEFFRATGSAVDHALRSALDREEDVALTEVIWMELLAGARVEAVEELRSRLLPFEVLPLRGLAGFEAAAELYRACRDAGETVGRQADCLIAVPAIEAGASLLHNDADFDKLARHTALEVVELDA